MTAPSKTGHVAFFGGTSRSRWLYLDATGMLSSLHDGTLTSLGGTLTAAPSPEVSVALGFTRNDVRVPDGSFLADISSLRASYSFSTRVSKNTLVQHNSLEEAFSTNVRFNFIHRPGSDFFVVFTENRGDDSGAWGRSERGLVMKLTYLARL